MKPLEYEVMILRLRHRPKRDSRITTHAGLVARAFGANGIIIADIKDSIVEDSLRKVVEKWGGNFTVESGAHWRDVVREWKKRDGEIVHLTMYGAAVDGVISGIRRSPRDKLVVVGAAKVPGELYSLADYNVSVTNQPHSEIAALCLFLDRLFEGKELSIKFHSTFIPRVASSKT